MTRFDLTGRFFESPRWHGGRWWISDMEGHVVYSMDAAGGDVRVEFELADRPSGLGWLPDGSLILVSMDRRALLRRAPGASKLTVHANLEELCEGISGYPNDMVVSPWGHAYVGFDPDVHDHGFQSELGAIIHVDPEGNADVARRGLHFPNGMVITADGALLIAAETGTPRLTGFGIDASGALAGQMMQVAIGSHADRRGGGRPVAQGTVLLDGCALDSQGHVWVADANSPACLRVSMGGDIVDAVFLPDNYRCLACAVGGPDGDTLLLCGVDLGVDGNPRTGTSHLFAQRLL